MVLVTAFWTQISVRLRSMHYRTTNMSIMEHYIWISLIWSWQRHFVQGTRNDFRATTRHPDPRLLNRGAIHVKTRSVLILKRIFHPSLHRQVHLPFIGRYIAGYCYWDSLKSKQFNNYYYYYYKICMSPVTGISSWYFSWTRGDTHHSGFKLHTAVLSVLCVMFQV